MWKMQEQFSTKKMPGVYRPAIIFMALIGNPIVQRPFC